MNRNDTKRLPRKRRAAATKATPIKPPSPNDMPDWWNCATGCETTVKQNAIAANMAAMSEMLAVSAARAAEAHQVMQAGEQNQAVGTLMGLDRELEDALALYRAAIALHQRRPQ